MCLAANDVVVAGEQRCFRAAPSAACPHAFVRKIETGPTMTALIAFFPLRRRRWQDAAVVRRAMRIWMATGSVPVAHMVAELDWTAEYPAAR